MAMIISHRRFCPRISRVWARKSIRCSPPARIGSTSTSWTITTCRISPSGRWSARHCARPGIEGADRRAFDGVAGRSSGAGFRQGGRDYISFHPGGDAACGSHDSADSRFGLQAGPGVQSGDIFELAGLRDRQDRSHPGDVGQPGFRRSEVHRPRRCRKLARSACAHQGKRSGISASRSTAASKWRMPPRIAKAGADTFVSGSAIFGSADYAQHHQGHARSNRSWAVNGA